MTKADIAEAVYKMGDDFTKKEAAELVDLVFETMKKTLASGEELKASGFGKWAAREKKPRMGRNPQTGQPLLIIGRKIVTFKPSQGLRDAINRGKARAAITGEFFREDQQARVG